MKKVIIFLFLFQFGIKGFSQTDTLTFTNEIEAGNHIYGLLNPALFDYALLNKSLTSNPLIFEQLKGYYNHIMTTEDVALIFSDIAISYTDTTLIPTITEMAENVVDFFYYHDYNYKELIQPFFLVLNNISYIDTTMVITSNFNTINGQLVPLVDETTLYQKALIKSASILEFYPDNGYSNGILKYDERFIVTSADIIIQNMKIDIGDGNGFVDFGPNNPEITYSRIKDSTVARVNIEFLIGDKMHYESILFYLTTSSKINKTENNENKSDDFFDPDCVFWDECDEWDFILDNDLTYEVGIKYGCGNDGKIRRPIIISPPYRPPIQAMTIDQYWYQFNIGLVYTKYVDLGYDIIFIKQKPGNTSLQEAGDEFIKLIESINLIKKINYPDEDWENIIMGYSAGGQSARYALMKMEKEHMENGAPHHHTRLYIPYDSPHHGVNIPLFTQATYKTFKLTNLLAATSNAFLVDPASQDMGSYSIYESPDLSSSGAFHKHLDAKPHPYAVDYQNELKNDFIHQFSHIDDTRRSFPTFTRNIAVSCGSYKNDYNMRWGMYPGMKLFSQNAPGYVITPLGFFFGSVNRNLWSSKYSTTEPQQAFRRFDVYTSLPLLIPIVISRKYSILNHYEFDMAQGGYKTLFYKGWQGSAVAILRWGGAGLGIKHYDDEMMFLPLVSSLAINPTIWQNNNLYYNLQDNFMFIIGFNSLGQPIVTDSYGYPHLGHTNHFQITPFEAVYADTITYDHIVMRDTEEDYTEVTESYFYRLSEFLVDEVEGLVVPLQNKVIGKNHRQTGVTPYEYKAWYKSRYEILIGNNITYKTDPGDFIIESTGNITAYAGHAIVMKDGFHAQAGSTFHGYIQEPPSEIPPTGCCFTCPPIPLGMIENTNPTDHLAFQEINGYRDENLFIDEHTLHVSLYPNPNQGNFVFEINQTNPEGNLNVYGIDGKLYFSQKIENLKTDLELNLNKGLYIVVYQDVEQTISLKMIIN